MPDRSTQSLAPPILGAIPEGSLIYSDELKSYNELDRHTYEHYTVNHSRGEYQRTEHAASGGVVSVHINTLEGVWTIVKSRDIALAGIWQDWISFLTSLSTAAQQPISPFHSSGSWNKGS